MKPYYERAGIRLYVGDNRDVLPAMEPRSVQTCITSPPYFGLRDYGHDGQIGLESTVDEYVSELVAVFREVRRVLADDGTFWLNIGDSYAGGTTTGRNDNGRPEKGKGWAEYTIEKTKHKRSAAGLTPKDLIGIPWRVAFALQADGWVLRRDVIWHKPNAMPDAAKDRPTSSHEYLFLFSKSQKYVYDADAIAEPSVQNPATTRNRRSVWSVAVKSLRSAHFAVFPPNLIEPCILAGSRPGDTVLDPFAGAGTTGLVAGEHGRNFIGLELNPEYAEIAARRIDHALSERTRTVSQPALEMVAD